jgi:hypothetical protein
MAKVNELCRALQQAREELSRAIEETGNHD